MLGYGPRRRLAVSACKYDRIVCADGHKRAPERMTLMYGRRVIFARCQSRRDFTRDASSSAGTPILSRVAALPMKALPDFLETVCSVRDIFTFWRASCVFHKFVVSYEYKLNRAAKLREPGIRRMSRCWCRSARWRRNGAHSALGGPGRCTSLRERVRGRQMSLRCLCNEPVLPLAHRTLR